MMSEGSDLEKLGEEMRKSNSHLISSILASLLEAGEELPPLPKEASAEDIEEKLDVTMDRVQERIKLGAQVLIAKWRQRRGR